MEWVYKNMFVLTLPGQILVYHLINGNIKKQFNGSFKRVLDIRKWINKKYKTYIRPILFRLKFIIKSTLTWELIVWNILFIYC